MFTGIISDVSDVVSAKNGGANLSLITKKPKSWTDLQLGESIAVNGACLTVASFDEDTFTCEIVPETLAKTIFGESMPKRVNLERAMLLSDRLDGHIVQGHVDFVGNVTEITKENGYLLSVMIQHQGVPYVIPKGSIALNGVSLTIATIRDNVVSVALIPFTLEHTTLGSLSKDNPVNVELDIIGKYIVHNLKQEN